MPSKNLFLTIIASLALIGCIVTTVPDNRPKIDSQPGIDFQELSIDSKDFLLVKIDPTKYALNIVENLPPPDSKSLNQIHQENNSAVTFNGSFYDQDFRPLGLLISDSKLIFPLNKSQLMNGVFTIDTAGNPDLLDFDQFQKNQSQLLPKIQFAIQSGPILLDKQGQIVIDKNNSKKASRTVLGLDKENNLIIIVLRQGLLNQKNALSLYEFAQIASSSKELNSYALHSLINLDGGTSSGLAIGDQYFPELEKVQNIITVSKRN